MLAGMLTGFPVTDNVNTRIATGLVLILAALAPTTLAAAQAASTPSDPCATGEPRARIIACSQAIMNAPTNAKVRVGALVNRGNAHDALDETALALRDYQAALDIDTNSVPALRSRAAVLYRHGENADALTDLMRAIALAPDDLVSLRMRGAVRAELGDISRAVEDYSKVLDRYPSDLPSREGRGLALASTGDHARAVQDFSRVLERDPRARVARAARAFSLFQLRRYKQAIADWDQLIGADPSQLPLVYCRGAAKVLSGDAVGGQADIDLVTQRQPETAAAQAAVCGTLRESR